MGRKILLIAPPFYRLMGSHYNGLHLGISYIAAVLKEHGHVISIYNTDYVDNNEYLNQTQLLENYSLYKEILNDISHPIWSEIRHNISDFSPDIVGMTMLTANYKAVKNIASVIKDISSNTRIAVGGTHPTLDPERTLLEENFDYLIRGEGEVTFLELAKGVSLDKIKGLSYKRNGTVIHNTDRPFIKDLDSLPFPCRDSFLNDTKYLDLGYIITGRGCPFSCTYCASPQLWHRTTRLRSVGSIIEELAYIQDNLGLSRFYFVDDTFSLDRNRAKEICQQIIARQLNIQWICDTRIDCIDDELLTLMKRAGCIRIKLGVESGSDKILANIRKGINKESVRIAVNRIKKAGLPLTIYLMIGFPDETNEDLKQTIDLGKELEADYYSLSILAPYYGTQIWSDFESSGRKLDKEHWEYFFHQSQDMIVNDGLDPELVRQFFALDKMGGGERA